MQQKEMPKLSVKFCDGNEALDAPRYDQIEVSLFGPGYGEGILLHVGCNNWLIIDSCINPTSKQPALLEYLQKIGINHSEQVKLVVATHWHDDHIRGLAKICQECRNAQLVFSAALNPPEFLVFVKAMGKRSMMMSSGVKEFNDILESLEERKKSGSQLQKFAIADRLIWRESLYLGNDEVPCEVHSLSPSDESIRLAFKEFVKLLPQELQPKKRVVAQRPNYTAIVLVIKIGEISILLGSDLENTKNPSTGWTVIVNSKTRPKEKASLLKIPHHGSKNADNPLMWSKMLEKAPISLLTPFVLGNQVLPSSSDVKRICEKTPYAFSSTGLLSKRPRFRNRTVEKTVKEVTKKIRWNNPSMGHIRVRSEKLPSPNHWTVELFGRAMPLSKLY